MSDVWVRGNLMADIHLAIVVLAGAAACAEKASNNVDEGIHIVGNTIERAAEAITVPGATRERSGTSGLAAPRSGL